MRQRHCVACETISKQLLATTGICIQLFLFLDLEMLQYSQPKNSNLDHNSRKSICLSSIDSNSSSDSARSDMPCHDFLVLFFGLSLTTLCLKDCEVCSGSSQEGSFSLFFLCFFSGDRPISGLSFVSMAFL